MHTYKVVYKDTKVTLNLSIVQKQQIFHVGTTVIFQSMSKNLIATISK